jgi:hypothetical protein
MASSNCNLQKRLRWLGPSVTGNSLIRIQKKADNFE